MEIFQRGCGLKLNIGAGHRRIEGYVGVDAVQRPGTDIIATANAIPLEDGCCDEIMAIHLFEHLYRWECDQVLVEWKRLLAPRGLLVLELPDLIKCCENILTDRINGAKHSDQLGLWGLYGDNRLEDPFMCHRWAWSPKSLGNLLKQHGFVDITNAETQFHPAGRARRDMRIEARKE